MIHLSLSNLCSTPCPDPPTLFLLLPPTCSLRHATQVLLHLGPHKLTQAFPSCFPLHPRYSTSVFLPSPFTPQSIFPHLMPFFFFSITSDHQDLLFSPHLLHQPLPTPLRTSNLVFLLSLAFHHVTPQSTSSHSRPSGTSITVPGPPSRPC